MVIGALVTQLPATAAGVHYLYIVIITAYYCLHRPRLIINPLPIYVVLMGIGTSTRSSIDPSSCTCNSFESEACTCNPYERYICTCNSYELATCTWSSCTCISYQRNTFTYSWYEYGAWTSNSYDLGNCTFRPYKPGTWAFLSVMPSLVN